MERKIADDFETIFRVISSNEFLKMEGLGGEVPFWIAPYDIQYQQLAQNQFKSLTNRLEREGIRPLILDLFEISVAIIEKHLGLDNIFYVEQKKRDKRKLKNSLQSTINLHERFIPYIVQQVKEHQPHLLILKGVGAVYPFIRSHNILNNLQSAITSIPTVMFFPGEYNGKALNLFGNLKDDNYYRAFNIYEYKLLSH